jgi:LysR family nitrogen assimilation transcriptional regulator
LFEVVRPGCRRGQSQQSRRSAGLTSVAISRQIAALERECGRRLFDRTGRGVALTEFEKRLHPHIKSLIVEADRVEALMKGKDERPSGEVRIGHMPSVAELLAATSRENI